MDVSHFLYSYAGANNKGMVVLCETKYINEVRKILKFENLEEIEVDSLFEMDQSQNKMVIIFNSTSGKLFYLPLQEKRELNFLKIFLS